MKRTNQHCSRVRQNVDGLREEVAFGGFRATRAQLEGRHTLGECGYENLEQRDDWIMAETLAHLLPHVNAGLNATATVLLLAGYVLIKQRREQAHKIAMLACFAVSIVFLACYLTHKGALHASTGEWNKRFPSDYGDTIRYAYLALLASHLLLAIVTPFLAITTIVLAWRDRRVAHRRWAKITFPIWLYVSITGVLIYFMLYQWFPARA